MKKLFFAICVAAMMLFLAAPIWALPLYPIDTQLAIYDDLLPSEESQKQIFADYLGYTIEELDLLYGTYVKVDGMTGLYLDGYDPGFAWEYALVKVGGPDDVTYLYMDDNGTLDLKAGDDLLTTGTPPNFNYDISHVSFMRVAAVPEPVPEPATMLLLGFGLIGLGAVGRKKLFK